MSQHPDTVFINHFKEIISAMFKPLYRAKPKVSVGDIGIFRNVFTFDTLNDDNHAVKYDVYMKVRTIAVFTGLVEVEILDVYTVNTCNQDIKTLIDSTKPKYVNPDSIRWEVK